MASIEKTSIALTHELAETVRDAVASGEYASTSEVVREALRDWRAKKKAQQSQVDELRRLWHEGLRSGSPIDGAEVIANARRRYRGRQQRAKQS